MVSAELSYLDFDLLIEGEGERYRARVVNSPAGQASTDFAFPFADLELENFRLRIGMPKLGMRRIDSPQMETVKAIGGRLFTSVFVGDVLVCLRSSLQEAWRQGRTGIRLRVRLDDDPRLAELPWEFLYDPMHNQFLARSIKTPVVRYLEQPGFIKPLAVRPPLRVLVMISSPTDYPELKVDREWQMLREALAEPERQGLVAVERLERPTWATLLRQLQRADYHVFHYIGHGGFDTRIEEGVLVFEDEERRGHPISAQRFGALLDDEDSLRLAILNACEGARSGTDPFAGTAQGLVQQGIPAVIAMQFEITDQAAATFTHAFYTASASGYPVDAALSEARKAIFVSGNDVEWGTPVLYMRSSDGQIFGIQGVSGAQQRRMEIVTLERDAQAAMLAENWPAAIARLQEILALEPAHGEAQEMLPRARAQQELAERYAAAREHQEAGRLQQALEAFIGLRGLRGDYRDVKARIAAIEQELRAQRRVRRDWREYAAAGGVLALLLVIALIVALQPARAELQITSTLPTGAQVLVNGAVVDAGTIRLRAGERHAIRLTAPGYLPLDSAFMLGAGERHSWAPQLQPLPPPAEPPADTSAPPPALAELSIAGDLPSGVQVRVDGRLVEGRTLTLPPGRYRVQVMAQGYLPLDSVFTLTAGEQRTWAPRLPPARAELRITGTQPAGLRILVDGQAVSGRTLSLQPGHRGIRLTAPGHQPLDTVFTLAAGEQRTWAPRLSRIVTPPPPPEPREETIRRIDELVAAYASAVEAQELSRMRSLYPTMTPAQQQTWESLFQSVRGLRVTVTRTDPPQIEGNTARVSFALTLSYRDSGGARQLPMSYNAVLTRQGGSAWRFQSIRP